jgi:hypothetical protein
LTTKRTRPAILFDNRELCLPTKREKLGSKPEKELKSEKIEEKLNFFH